MAAQYRILRTLGAGSYGAVYLADVVGSELGREVAVKMLHPQHARRPRLVAKLRDEARILSMVRHRAIVQVQDLVEADGGWAIVMEYVPGMDLATALERAPVPPRAALEVIEESASALHAAANQADRHGNPLGLVHRDVKPGNIRVTRSGEVKLLDFGVAHAEFVGKEAATFTAAVGTLPYMAPERFEGCDTAAGDVYALGITLFQLLTCTFPGNEAGSLERVFPGRERRPEWLAIERVSRDLVRLLSAMLAPAPDARPSARDVARTCRELAGSVGGLALADWAEASVEAPAVAAPDPRVGTILVTGASALPGPKDADDGASPAGGVPPAAATWGGEASAVPASAVLERPTAAPVDPSPHGVAASPRGATPSAPSPGVIPAEDAATPPAARGLSGRSSSVWLGLSLGAVGVSLAGLVLVVAGVGYLLWRRGEPPQDVVQAAVTAPAAVASPSLTPTPPVAQGSASSTSASSNAPPAARASQAGPSSTRRTTTSAAPTTSARAAPSDVPADEGPVGSVAEPPPEAPAPRVEPQPASSGRVVFTGAPVEADLVQGERVVSRLAAAPGRYDVRVRFEDGTTITVPQVDVRAGETTELRCDARFKTCAPLH